MTTSAAERTRVRRFSLAVGLLVAVVVAGTWAWRAHQDPLLLGRAKDDSRAGDYTLPWDVTDPGTARLSGDTIKGPAGGSVLHLAAADRPGSLALTTIYVPEQGSNEVDVYVGGVYDDSRPEFLGIAFSDTPAVIPAGDGDLELWFSADRPWTITVTPLDAKPLVDQADGVGETYLEYQGPDTPHRLHLTCPAGPGTYGPPAITLIGFSIAKGYDGLSHLSCPGEVSTELRHVPTVVRVTDYDDAGWTLTLEDLAPEPGPSGEPE